MTAWLMAPLLSVLGPLWKSVLRPLLGALVLSLVWLTLCATLGRLLLSLWFGFDGWQGAAWRALLRAFDAGSALRFDFVLLLAALLLVTVLGQLLLLWRLPDLLTWLPTLPAWPLRRRPRAAPMPWRIPAPPPLAMPAAPQTPPSPAATTADSGVGVLARLLTLSEIWQEPPPVWLEEALKAEAAAVPAAAWQRLTAVGAPGRDLLQLLLGRRLLSDPDAAARALQAVQGLEPGPVDPLPSGSAPILTVAAAWLAELLDSVIDTAPTPMPLPAAVRDLVGRALRSMRPQDWASLDRMPERASRIRTLSDRLGEQLRPPARAVDTGGAGDGGGGGNSGLVALLRQAGFSCDAADFSGAPVLAVRGAVMLLLQLIDLEDQLWQLPQGCLGLWQRGDGQARRSPCAALWRRLTVLRRQHPEHRVLALALLRHGRPQPGLAAALMRQPDPSGVELAWLQGGVDGFADLQRRLDALLEPGTSGGRSGQTGRSAAPPC